MTAKWDKENAHRYKSIKVNYKKNTSDEEVIKEFKKVDGSSYIEKIKYLLEYYIKGKK